MRNWPRAKILGKWKDNGKWPQAWNVQESRRNWKTMPKNGHSSCFWVNFSILAFVFLGGQSQAWGHFLLKTFLSHFPWIVCAGPVSYSVYDHLHCNAILVVGGKAFFALRLFENSAHVLESKLCFVCAFWLAWRLECPKSIAPLQNS